MDIELREILDKVYANKMKPDEAQWKICVLVNVSKRSELVVCDCGNKLTDKEMYFGQCLQCDAIIEE